MRAIEGINSIPPSAMAAPRFLAIAHMILAIPVVLGVPTVGSKCDMAEAKSKHQSERGDKVTHSDLLFD